VDDLTNDLEPEDELSPDAHRLMICSVCEGKVSSAAPGCPHCGHPLSSHSGAAQEAAPQRANSGGCWPVVRATLIVVCVLAVLYVVFILVAVSLTSSGPITW